ncbi:uncharacterized protein EV420DRAFT_1477107 [Desarmillaria tabescens]|uniref:Uncharacterized protein n=1 Tax=Armillaria tabescens TaxID=1929756 RepID=A0AA39TSJ9_ARMTA|nr:uncharacterized protein EV420DRAFT_1477107 [Desarmillaria tabescens]KAK0462374.1 hypothetical protein EV420DRAFT_1477107 [Desarmillaria tabescens]
MAYPICRYKDQWRGYGSQCKMIPRPPPPLMIWESHVLNAKRQDRLVHNEMPSRSAVVLPPPSEFDAGHTTMSPSLPLYDGKMRLSPTHTLKLKRVASQNQSNQIQARYFFLYGFVCPPLWLLGILVLIYPLRRVCPSSSSLPTV